MSNTTNVPLVAPAPTSLVSKLAEVMAAVERIPKRGRNDFHHYDYATEADIAATVRAELAARHVMLIPAIVGESRHPVGEKGSVLTVLEMEMEFLDGESGESIKKLWRGYGTDKEDKGGYKAMTGGEKYFLLKTFLMPTGDDPEAETPEKRTPEQRTADRQAHAASTTAAVETLRTPPNGKAAPVGLRVAQIEAKQGRSAKGPWTLYILKFSDGREGVTFSDTIADVAKAAKQAGSEVDLTLVPGKKPNSFEVFALAHVRRVNADLEGLDPGEVPPWMTSEEIPFS